MKKHILCLKPRIYAAEFLNMIAVSPELLQKKEKIIPLEYKKSLNSSCSTQYFAQMTQSVPHFLVLY